jgi:TPR repeat protein
MYYWDKRDFGQAAQLFRRGVQAGDPDAMVSLAEMIDHQDTEPLNPSETKLELYRRAAQLGSDAAKRGYADEQAQAPKPQQQRFNQLQQQQMILGVVNGFLQNIPRR